LVDDSLGLHKISKNFSRNSFFLKFPIRISAEFWTKRDKFQVKRMSIHIEKNQTVSQTNIPLSLTMMNKKFIANLVERIGAQISAKTQ